MNDQQSVSVLIENYSLTCNLVMAAEKVNEASQSVLVVLPYIELVKSEPEE